MTEVRVRTVDAFTDRPFTGNPAAVVVLENTPPDEWMAAVARETNLSDTGFVLRDQLPDADFRLRWFTRGAVEVDLCGHAILASAHCLLLAGIISARPYFKARSLLLRGGNSSTQRRARA